VVGESPPFLQIAWGAFASLFTGFSFSGLRLSTVLLAWVGTTAFYATLRRLGCSRTQGLLGTLILTVNPVFFILTFTFMTDVPFVSLVNIACFLVVEALVEGRQRHLWAGSLVAAAGFFTRVIAPAVPLAILVYLLATPNFGVLDGWFRLRCRCCPFS
jgi:dolichyl-phosphate-mannose--protein O-mannosyl transferase